MILLHFSAVNQLNATCIFYANSDFSVPCLWNKSVICLWYVTKLVMYKTCSPVMYQLRVRTAGGRCKIRMKHQRCEPSALRLASTVATL